MRHSLAWMFLAALILVVSAAGRTDERAEAKAGEFRVVGYLPDYRLANYDLERARDLTDLVVFSSQVTPQGELDLGRLQQAPWDKLRDFKTRHRVRLILCVGGWERSAGFAAVSATPAGREKFAEAAVKLCLAQRLDGLDLDWEHPEGAAEQEHYAQLLTALKARFQPHGLQLTVTMAAWQQLPATGFAAVDAVQIMAYDNPGRHSTYDGAVKDVESLLARGVPAHKLVLGLPAYGRHPTQRNKVLTYAEIISRYHPTPDSDEADGLYFNGLQTIQKKTRFAREHKLGGVMLWELGQDTAGNDSLLHAITDTAR